MKIKNNKCLCCGELVHNKYCNVTCQNKHFWKDRKKSKGSIEKMVKTKKSKWETFTVTCYKCGEQLVVDEYNVDKPKKEKYYCSRSCANSREWSSDDKKKKSDIAKQSIKITMANKEIGEKRVLKYNSFSKIKYCTICGDVFDATNTKKKTCSSKCHQILLSNTQIKMYKENKNHVAGGTTTWLEVETSLGVIKVQGSYEVRTCKILDKLKHSGDIKEWEYTNDKIQYVDVNGKTRNYLLDFKVFDNVGGFYYIETKGFKRENDELKWKQTRKLGYKLLIWFNNDITEQENMFKKQKH